jgi:hypothetical protein
MLQAEAAQLASPRIAAGRMEVNGATPQPELQLHPKRCHHPTLAAPSSGEPSPFPPAAPLAAPPGLTAMKPESTGPQHPPHAPRGEAPAPMQHVLVVRHAPGEALGSDRHSLLPSTRRLL